MILKKILLKNFRNFSNIEFVFDKNLNIITGKNGTGKTTILESFHFLSYTKSFKTNYDTEVIKKGNNYFQIFGEFFDNNKNTHVNLNFTEKEGKRTFINKKKLVRKIDIIGKYPLILLSPEDQSITKGNPSVKRNFIDKIISQIDKQYLFNLVEYNKRITQRNYLLKTYKINNKYIYDEYFESLDDLLITNAKTITQKRNKFINDYNPIFKNELEKISHFNYKSTINIINNIELNEENYFTNYKNKLEEKFVKDVKFGRTSRGPHLDKISILFDGIDIKKIASQGEHKVVLIALKIAEGMFLQNHTNSCVIYLLDDLFSFLDSEHCVKIINKISSENQTFVTTTSMLHLNDYLGIINHLNFNEICLD